MWVDADEVVNEDAPREGNTLADYLTDSRPLPQSSAWHRSLMLVEDAARRTDSSLEPEWARALLGTYSLTVDMYASFCVQLVGEEAPSEEAAQRVDCALHVLSCIQSGRVEQSELSGEPC